MVAFLQPCALVRSVRRHHRDDCRGDAYSAPASHLDRGSRNGESVLHPIRGLDDLRSGYRSRSRPSPFGKPSAACDVGADPGGMWCVVARSDRRHYGSRRFTVRLALVRDCGGTVAGATRRRAQSCAAGSGALSVTRRAGSCRRHASNCGRRKRAEVPAAPASPDASSVAEWPGFRGPDRDSVVHGVQIQTDWSTSPPVQIWRRAIGPGWSSFAVQGDVLYTQEQRGEDEIVAAYKVSTGEPVWRHRDPARFYESNGGAGPRGTPTLAHGRVYTFGATGILNVLDARTGARLWSRNAATDTGRKVPDWGFASSPLVLNDEVVVAVSGTLAAYDLSGGKPAMGRPRARR